MTDLNISISDLVQTAQRQESARRYLLSALDTPNEYALQIDNSSLECFASCPRKAYHQLVLGRTSPRSSALLYGSALHAALESWYELPLLKQNDRLRVAITAIEHEYQTSGMNVTDWRTSDRCIDTLIRYTKHYNNKDFSVLTRDDNTPHVETAFSVPLGVIEIGGRTTGLTHADLVKPGTYTCDPSTPVTIDRLHIYWSGKIDLFVKQHNLNWVADHKTTSVEGPTFYSAFDLASQTIGYTWVGEQLLGLPVAGLIVNVITGRPITKTGTSTSFNRHRYRYTQEQRDEWKQDTLHLVSTFVSYLLDNYFPKSTFHCVNKFGMCPYHEVCTLPSNTRNLMLYSDTYANNTWSPLD